LKKSGEKFGGLKENAYLCTQIIRQWHDAMHTFTAIFTLQEIVKREVACDFNLEERFS